MKVEPFRDDDEMGNNDGNTVRSLPSRIMEEHFEVKKCFFKGDFRNRSEVECALLRQAHSSVNFAYHDIIQQSAQFRFQAQHFAKKM